MKKKGCALAVGASLALASVALAVDVTVTVENLSPANGTWITPVWVGFHDGSFDVFDLGSGAPESLERVAEDGDTSVLSADFALSGAGTVDGTMLGPVDPQIAPGQSTSMTFDLDAFAASSRWMSFASMVIPSNDAFIGNDDPLAFAVFDGAGNFIGGEFIVAGSMVRDAGTEVNDELPENTAFFGQMTPDTGVDEFGVVHAHPGFMMPGSGGILDDPMFAAADFMADGYQVARITIVPEPAALTLLALGAAGMLRRRARGR